MIKASILRNSIILTIVVINLNAEFAVNSYKELRNQGVIRQSYEESCGAASVATLINNLDFNNISEHDVLEQMKDKNNVLNTNMVSFKQLQDAAARLGYKSSGYQINRESFAKLNIPAIVKIEQDPRFPHFVVVINHDGDFMTVLDPNFGRYTSTKQEFYKIWDKNNKGGYALILAPKNKLLRNYTIEIPNKVLFEK